MSKPDRIRACYQHCALKYVSNERMSNQSLRERFRLPESKAATASQVIGATKDAGLINRRIGHDLHAVRAVPAVLGLKCA
jgi:ATP-dependent DNA helicase RecG